MALSHLAQAFADEIAGQDWSDAPFRADRAGHQIYRDSPDKAVAEPLNEQQTNSLLMNLILNTGQVLAYLDPGFDIHEYALAAGLPPRRAPGEMLHTVFNRDGKPSGALPAGLRYSGDLPLPPGRWYPLEADAKLLGIATALRDMKIPHAWGGGGLHGPSQGAPVGGVPDEVKEYYETVGFDAGSLSMYLLYQAYGVEIPRTTMIQFQLSRPVTGSRRPGDLVFPAGTDPYDGMTLVDADTVARIGGPGDFLELLPYADFAASFPEVRRIL